MGVLNNDRLQPLWDEKSEGLQSCIICDQKKENGIVIYTEFICDECEAEILRTDAKDEKYTFFINQLKRIWYMKNA